MGKGGKARGLGEGVVVGGVEPRGGVMVGGEGGGAGVGGLGVRDSVRNG